MVRIPRKYAWWLAALLASAGAVFGQAPEGPITPKPGERVQQAPPEAQAKLKIGVNLVNMAVTVRSHDGAMVHDLQAKDFHITDNGIEQKITHFDLGGDPVSVVILIETSSRVESLLPELRKTGILFTQTVMGPAGEGAVVGFNDSVDKLQDFTTNANAIETTVGQLQTGTSGLRLYDAMAVGIEMLSDRPQPTPEKPGRRRILLVMSEAMDSGSEMKFGEVLRRAQLANVTIYSVGLSTTRAEWHNQTRESPSPIAPPGISTVPGPPGMPQTAPPQSAAQSGGVDLLGIAIWAVQHVEGEVKARPLEVATVGTGGAYYSTFKDQSIEKAIDEIGGELHAQYTVSYAPTDGDQLGYHEIRVELDRKDLKVRARPGYYVAPPAS
ncbi:MAG TPA: VWA domain-containing protein [Candidatus Acidoferrum sp.]|nr:VWA domain-containing protein [Candidatus Acidoferrum sp.]